MTRRIHLQRACLREYTCLSVHGSKLSESGSSLTRSCSPTEDVFHFGSEHINEHTADHDTFSNRTQIDSYCCFEVVIKDLHNARQPIMKKPFEEHVYA